MISQPTNIVATPKTVNAVVTAVLEYENEEKLESDLEMMDKLSKGETLSFEGTERVQEYYNEESGELRLTGSWAARHNLLGVAVDNSIMTNLVLGMSPDGKNAPRYKTSHDGIMKYDFLMDMTYSSNKYINIGFAIGDFETKKQLKEIHNTGNDVLSKLLDDFWLVEVDNKFVKPISRVEAQVDHYKSRSDELLLHKHRLTSRGCEVLLSDGTVGYRLLDESFIKNGSNRLMMDIISKNAELNECIARGFDVDVVDKELSQITGDNDMSFYKLIAFEEMKDMFGTEQKIIHETYKNSLSEWHTELVDLLDKTNRNEGDRKRIAVLESKLDKKNKTRELGFIAKDIRTEKSSSTLDEVCKKQLDEVLKKYPDFKQKNLLAKSKKDLNERFKVGEPLTDKEIKNVLKIVFDKQHSSDQLRVMAMIANTHKGRFNYEQLKNQFSVIESKYLKSRGIDNGMNMYISKAGIFTQIHLKNQIKLINKDVVAPLFTSTQAKEIITEINANLEKLAKPQQLNTKQQEAIVKGLINTRRAFIVSAPPGSGKTLAVAKPIIDSLRATTQGRVYGAVVSNNASNILQNEIKADEGLNITKLVSGLRDGSIELTEQDIVCIDEASMLALKDASEIMEKVVNARSRIVFIGDIRQLHSVGAGNAMDLLLSTINDDSKIQLDKVVRQKNPHQAKVVELIGDISDRKGLAQYTLNRLLMNRQVQFRDSKEQTFAKLMKDYVASVKTSDLAHNKIYAHTVDDVITLNNTAIKMLIKENLIGANHINTQYVKRPDDLGLQKQYDISLHEKSRVMFKDTFKYQDVMGDNQKIVNGQAGEIVSILGNSVTIKMDDGQVATVNTNTFKSLMPAMAQSLHSSQGDTVGKTFTYIDKAYSRKLLLIGISRGKEDNQLYVNGDEDTLMKVLKTDGNNTNVLANVEAAEIDVYEKAYEEAIKANGNDFEKINESIDFETLKSIVDKLDEVNDEVMIENDDVIATDNNNNKELENGTRPISF